MGALRGWPRRDLAAAELHLDLVHPGREGVEQSRRQAVVEGQVLLPVRQRLRDRLTDIQARTGVGDLLPQRPQALDYGRLADEIGALAGAVRHRGHLRERAEPEAGRTNRLRDSYGPNSGPARRGKRRYDPDNLFRLNQNITPD